MTWFHDVLSSISHLDFVCARSKWVHFSSHLLLIPNPPTGRMGSSVNAPSSADRRILLQLELKEHILRRKFCAIFV